VPIFCQYPPPVIDDPKIPAAVVQDLLAIARALHAARKAQGAPVAELDKLESAAEALTLSLSMAHLASDTIGGRTAWASAEIGLRLLSEALCAEAASARVFVAAWGGRLLGRGE
jgi:hypothetical protein